MHVTTSNRRLVESKNYVSFKDFAQNARNHQKLHHKKGDIYGIIRKSKKTAGFINPD